MEEVLRWVQKRGAVLNTHPFFEWVESDETPLEARLLFLPCMANFSMGFRDVNKWVLRYPHAENALQRGINIHTFEDQTHSRLYLEDWRRLGLDERLGWRASDTLWWLFLAEANEPARDHGVYLLSMAAADGNDPLLRFAQMEVIEACGAVFFKRVAQVTQRFTEKTGVVLPYLGMHHLALESGHMDCEDLFESQPLDHERRAQALKLVDTLFDIFTDTFDMWLRYARSHVATGTSPRQPGYQVATAAPAATGGVRPRVDGAVHDCQHPLQQLLDERRARTAKHPFYAWLNHRGGNITALQALQRFLPMWAMDIMGYRDLNRYAMRYAEPRTELERAVNGWVDDLTTHNILYLKDWQQLRLDELLGWSASDTLEFLFLDSQVDRHRHNIVKFTELAARYPDPLLRLWLMHALEATGEAMFENCRRLVREIEARTDVRLDYLGDRHDIVHQASATTAAPVSFKDLPMTVKQRAVVVRMIETVFDAVDEQLDISLDVALSNRFAIP